jgi:glycolate oxidase FAD binding subunit
MTDTLKPADAAQVLDAITWAASNETALELVAGGTKQGLGRPVAAEHRLDLSGLTGISLYAPEELVLTAAPGTPLREIEGLLAQNRQMLAFEPPDYGELYGGAAGQQTLGGIVACNLAGPRRIKIGAARDHVLGVKGVSGRAEAFKSGGQVVKNVTGYDLSKLMTGSYGTLAALTEVTVKVLPVGEKLRTVLVFGLDPEPAVKAMAAAAGSPHEVSALAHLPVTVAGRSSVSYIRDAGAPVTAVRVEGPAPSVEHRTAALKEALAGFGPVEELHSTNTIALWSEVRDVAPLLPGEGRALWRLSVAPMAAPGALMQIQRSIAAEALFDWAGGLVWLAVQDEHDAGAAIIRNAIGAGGHAALIRAAAATRTAVPVFQPQAAALAALSQRVKNAFDPLDILNPGRMYGPGVAS